MKSLQDALRKYEENSELVRKLDADPEAVLQEIGKMPELTSQVAEYEQIGRLAQTKELSLKSYELAIASVELVKKGAAKKVKADILNVYGELEEEKKEVEMMSEKDYKERVEEARDSFLQIVHPNLVSRETAGFIAECLRPFYKDHPNKDLAETIEAYKKASKKMSN